MTIGGIDHINIGTERLEETRAFFRDVLGLKEGYRPNFAFGGAWLYAGERAVVHLVDLPEGRRPSSEAALDHFAFTIDDWDDAVARLTTGGSQFRIADVPGAAIRQIFVCDPNGVNIELNYRVPATRNAAVATAGS
ncbi:MAG TPA: VOC family protein [Caulobacteraceae bacterium]|nr:VOC family protein [Caulobacteraceae bacterium]